MIFMSGKDFATLLTRRASKGKKLNQLNETAVNSCVQIFYRKQVVNKLLTLNNCF